MGEKGADYPGPEFCEMAGLVDDLKTNFRSSVVR